MVCVTWGSGSSMDGDVPDYLGSEEGRGLAWVIFLVWEGKYLKGSCCASPITISISAQKSQW